MSTVEHVSLGKQDTHVNIDLFKSQIEEKLQEIAPVIGFYTELRDGWMKRISLAEAALRNFQWLKGKDFTHLNELISIANIEVGRIDEMFSDALTVSVALQDKIQDLNMLALRQSSSIPDLNVNFEINAVRKVIFQADALLELRQEKIKELAS